MDVQEKTPIARERDAPDVQARREAFIASQPDLDPTRLVFVDESGFKLGSPPRYGWAKRGVDAPGKCVHGAWKTITMIGALALDGFRSLITFDAATGADVFIAFVRDALVPTLKPGDIVVMDNLAAHRNGEALRAIRACGADVRFLPPYSPELNPIEKSWGKLKDFVCRLNTLTREAFDDAIAKAIDAVTTNDIAGWTAHAGYRLSSRCRSDRDAGSRPAGRRLAPHGSSSRSCIVSLVDPIA